MCQISYLVASADVADPILIHVMKPQRVHRAVCTCLACKPPKTFKHPVITSCRPWLLFQLSQLAKERFSEAILWLREPCESKELTEQSSGKRRLTCQCICSTSYSPLWNGIIFSSAIRLRKLQVSNVDSVPLVTALLALQEAN